MPTDGPTTWFHNRYSAQAACKHCQGVIRHEPWCIAIDPVVYYAYQVVQDPSKLTVGDALILHSLGATWVTSRAAVPAKQYSRLRRRRELENVPRS